MAFLFSAIYTQNHISRLERRIESLEKQAGPRTVNAYGRIIGETSKCKLPIVE